MLRGATRLATLALATALAGCGSGGGAPQAAGQSLFTKDCGFCHSLTGRQSPRHQGGDLLNFHISRTAMLEFAREMPVLHPLSPSELSAVADYVLAVESRRRPG
jgi:mono/diheme cytochrome c family protein